MRDKLHEGYFQHHRDRMIWEAHETGASREEISKLVGLEGSWVTRRIDRIKNYLETGSICSISAQMALF